jgi:hypothetical protein
MVGGGKRSAFHRWRPNSISVGSRRKATPPIRAALAATPIPRADVVVAHHFVLKALRCLGAESTEIPTQKQFLKMGMTTTKQQKARRFLRTIGAVVINTRTQISSRFHTLLDILQFLQTNFPISSNPDHGRRASLGDTPIIVEGTSDHLSESSSSR